MRRDPGALRGRGLAVAGLVLGYVSLLVFAVLFTLNVLGSLPFMPGRRPDVISDVQWRDLRAIYRVDSLWVPRTSSALT